MQILRKPQIDDEQRHRHREDAVGQRVEAGFGDHRGLRSARDQHPIIQIEDHGGIIVRAGLIRKIGARPVLGGDRADPERTDVAAPG